MRILFAFLVLLNLGYFGWHLYAPAKKPSTPLPEAPDVPSLVLLTEREGEQQELQSPVVATPQPPKAEVVEQRPTEVFGSVGRSCFTLGPLRKEELAAALADRLRGLGLDVDQRALEQQEVAGHWVYLPPFDSRKAALRTARDLAEKGVKDYYVVTDEENRNGISLGLFSEPARAERRADYIRSLGYRPRTTIRYRTRTVYWLDYDEVGERRLPAEILEEAGGGVQRIDRACPDSGFGQG